MAISFPLVKTAGHAPTEGEVGGEKILQLDMHLDYVGIRHETYETYKTYEMMHITTYVCYLTLLPGHYPLEWGAFQGYP